MNVNNSEQILNADQVFNPVANPNPEREPVLALLFDRLSERACPMTFDQNWRGDGVYLINVMDLDIDTPQIASDKGDVVLFIPSEDSLLVLQRSAAISNTIIAHCSQTRQIRLARAVDGVETKMRMALTSLVGPVDDEGNRVFNPKDVVPGYLMRLIDQDLPKLSHDDLLNYQLMYFHNDSQLVVDKFLCDLYEANDLTDEQRATSVLAAVESHMDSHLHYLFIHEGEVGFLYTEKPNEPFRYFGTDRIGQLLGIDADQKTQAYISYDKFERLVELFAPKRLDSFRSARRPETLKPVERMLKIDRRERAVKEFTSSLTRPFNVKIKVAPTTAKVAKGTAVTLGLAGLAYLGYRAYEELSA